jgi:hypothetical protein
MWIVDCGFFIGQWALKGQYLHVVDGSQKAGVD